MTKTCLLCHKEKNENKFSFRNKAKGTRVGRCKTCIRKQIRKHYSENRNYYLLKARNRNSEVRNRIKNYIWNYLSAHSCVDCGEKDPVVLEFDHISDKISAVSAMYRNYTLDTVIMEINKCEVRCANCHRRKTARERGWYKKITPS